MLNEKSVSKSQQRLMGFALSCINDRSKDCPENIKKVAKSFLKNKNGLKKLKDFAKTKHYNLPERVEEVMSFKKFNETYTDSQGTNRNDSNVVDYLYSLDNNDVNVLTNDLISSHNPSDIIEDILLEIGDMDLVSDEKYHWVEDELKKEYKNK